jgi:hypothetical protein
MLSLRAGARLRDTRVLPGRLLYDPRDACLVVPSGEEHELRLYRDAHSFYPRPHALRGDASPHALRELRRGRLQPVDDHRNERRQRCIIPRARISPVNAIVHVPAPHRVVVDVLQLLPHHGLVGDHPRMASLLPELMISVRPAGDEVGILGVTKLVATSAHGELFGHA